MESCVLYYICGYVTRYINKHIKCNNCQIAVQGKTFCDMAEATLTNIKTRGGLIHPSTFLFNLLTNLEESFQKFCNDYDVFQQTVDDFFNKKLKLINTFPCSMHKIEVLTFIISYYIKMRMCQYTKVLNNDQKKRIQNLLIHRLKY
uniref:Transposable element P transposase n=1 Tax=Schizaphis graminum TaxID=13262 RepID=A0A2S2NXE1_SCHGA